MNDQENTQKGNTMTNAIERTLKIVLAIGLCALGFTAGITAALVLEVITKWKEVISH